MSEVTTQAKPERRKRQKLEDMEGYKPSIYGLTRDELIDLKMVQLSIFLNCRTVC